MKVGLELNAKKTNTRTQDKLKLRELINISKL
jgi:hypothetical protein